MQLHTSGEDYLEAILILEKTTGKVRSIDLAEHLGVTKPSVSRAVSLLKQGGFLVSESLFLELTEKGRDTAKKVYEKHCFFKEKLMEAGVDEKTAEKEACLLEHAVSEDSFGKLKANSLWENENKTRGRPSDNLKKE